MNNRKRTRGRKFQYVQAMKTQETKFGPASIPDGNKKVKVAHVGVRIERTSGDKTWDPKKGRWVDKKTRK